MIKLIALSFSDTCSFGQLSKMGWAVSYALPLTIDKGTLLAWRLGKRFSCKPLVFAHRSSMSDVQQEHKSQALKISTVVEFIAAQAYT
jgi:hypothetical protein